jgi:hypothetical protein
MLYSTHTCSTLLSFNCENGFFIQNLYGTGTFHEVNTCVALPNAWRRSVRVLSQCYHNNNGSQSTVVKTVEHTRVVFHVAEPKLGKEHCDHVPC